VLAWIFFRANDVKHALSYISEIFSGSLFTIPHFPGIERSVTIALLTVIFLVIEWNGREQQYAIANLATKWHKPVRWSVYYGIFLIIFYFAGKEQQFIYFQF
jgi:alginate O-acetyltransferase complex protein AlgI